MNDVPEKPLPLAEVTPIKIEPPKSHKIEQPFKEKITSSLESCEEKVQKVHETMEGDVEVKTKVEKLQEKPSVEEKKSATMEKEKDKELEQNVSKKSLIENPTRKTSGQKLHEGDVEIKSKVEKVDEKPTVGEEKYATMEKEKDKKLEQNMSKKSLTENPIKKTSDSLPCCTKQSREKIVRNQSDIFSLKEISTTLQTSIFSVNGSPSRRVFRKQEPAGHVFQRSEDRASGKGTAPRTKRITRENYNDEKRPSSSYRNPLTGTGLSSNDEYKSKGIKRKDGNPLLGLGYDSEVTSTASEHRVPPGGFSHKLW